MLFVILPGPVTTVYEIIVDFIDSQHRLQINEIGSLTQ